VIKILTASFGNADNVSISLYPPRFGSRIWANAYARHFPGDGDSKSLVMASDIS